MFDRRPGTRWRDAPGDAGQAYLEERLTQYGPYQAFGMCRGRYKYIWEQEFEERGERRLLFDVVSDPQELNDLHDAEGTLAADLHRDVTELRRRFEARALPRAHLQQVSPERLEALRALGYVDEEDAENEADAGTTP
jgi:hypothetical protein